MLCYRHPKVETALRCGRCDRPICIKCSIPGPAGMRCPECSSLKSSTLYKVNPGRLVLAVILGLLTGTIGAAILFSVSFFVFFIGPAYGIVVAEAVLRASGRKRGRLIEAIGVGSIVVGAIAAGGIEMAPLMFAAHAANGLPYMQIFMDMIRMFVWPLIGVALAISSCFSKIRYF